MTSFYGLRSNFGKREFTVGVSTVYISLSMTDKCDGMLSCKLSSILCILDGLLSTSTVSFLSFTLFIGEIIPYIIFTEGAAANGGVLNGGVSSADSIRPPDLQVG